MPDFRTTLAVQKENFSIQHQDQLLSLGSCFAQHIGTRLQAKKFSTVLNPFGILYNPASIVHSLESLLHQKSFVRSNLFEHQGIWYSFAHHGHFSDPDPEKALEKINRSFYQGQAQIHEAKCLLITLGTAQVFQHKKSGQIVANCHKLPAKAFQEQELSSTKIIELFSTLFQQLNDQFPKLKIILSLSPIRHLRHGLINNQRSKAQLLLAIHELVQQFSFVSYFPAYEMVLDDLRDYRFYEADLIHPNDQAIHYIWTYFSDTFFDLATQKINQQLEQLERAVAHRAFHPHSKAHQQFVQQQLKKIESLKVQYPFLDFRAEQAHFEQQYIE